MSDSENLSLAKIEILKSELDNEIDNKEKILKILDLAKNISEEKLLDLEGKNKIGEILKDFAWGIDLHDAFQKYCDPEELIIEWLLSSQWERVETKDNFLPKYVNFDSLFTKLVFSQKLEVTDLKVLKDFLNLYPEQRLDILRNVTKYDQFNELRFKYGLSAEQILLLQNGEFDKLEKPFDMFAVFSSLGDTLGHYNSNQEFVDFLKRFPEDRENIIECIPAYFGAFPGWEDFREKFMTKGEIEAYCKFTNFVRKRNDDFEEVFEEIIARKEYFAKWVEDSQETELNLLDEFLEELLYFVVTNSKHSELTELVSLGLEINPTICWDFCVKYPYYPIWKKLAETLCVKTIYIFNAEVDDYFSLMPFITKIIEDLGAEKILEEMKNGEYPQELKNLCKSFIKAKKFEKMQVEQGKLLPRKVRK